MNTPACTLRFCRVCIPYFRSVRLRQRHEKKLPRAHSAIDATHYTYRARWSEEDGEFLATVAEFPSLSWLDGDNVLAYEGIVGLVAGVVADMEAANA